MPDGQSEHDICYIRGPGEVEDSFDHSSRVATALN